MSPILPVILTVEAIFSPAFNLSMFTQNKSLTYIVGLSDFCVMCRIGPKSTTQANYTLLNSFNVIKIVSTFIQLSVTLGVIVRIFRL